MHLLLKHRKVALQNLHQSKQSRMKVSPAIYVAEDSLPVSFRNRAVHMYHWNQYSWLGQPPKLAPENEGKIHR